jgi:hypothetical protein
MMCAGRCLRVLTVLSWLAASGCTTLREIPRDAYAAAGERKHVSVDTREGLHYEFDFARFDNDTLTGYRQRDTEGVFEEFATLAVPLDAIARLSARRVDWYRTGLMGAAALAAIVVAAWSRHKGAAAGPDPRPDPIPCPPGCPE